jgi:O-antigen/teichoic acid export membrane protein
MVIAAAPKGTLRIIAAGITQLTLSNVFVRLVSIVTMPVLTRLLAPSAFGTAALATTFISLIAVVALAGADVSYIRAYHAEKLPFRQAVESFTWRFALASSLVAAILSVLCWSIIAPALSLPLYPGPLIAAGVVLGVTVAMSAARARLHHRYRAISLATIVCGVAAPAIAILVAYVGRRDALPLILSVLAIYLIPALALGFPPAAALLKPSGLSYSDRRRILGIGAAIVVTAPAYWVMASSDRWFLGYFADAGTVGIYSISCSVAIVGLTVNSALLTIWTPEASRLFESSPGEGLTTLASMTEAMIALLACVWLAVSSAGGDLIRLFTAPPFHSASATIPFVAGGVFFYGVAHLAQTAYLLEGRLHYTLKWWAAGAAASVILNTLLIPALGLMGAAFGQLIAFAIPAFGLSIGARSLIYCRCEWKHLFFVLSVVFCAALFMIPPWSAVPLMSLIFKFPPGLIIVAIALATLRRDTPIVPRRETSSF